MAYDKKIKIINFEWLHVEKSDHPFWNIPTTKSPVLNHVEFILHRAHVVLHVSEAVGRKSQSGLSGRTLPIGVWANLDFWILVQHERSFWTRKKLNKPKINSSSYIHQRNEITGQTTVPKIEKTNRELQLNHPIRGPEARNSAETSRNLTKCGQRPASRRKERGWRRQLN